MPRESDGGSGFTRLRRGAGNAGPARMHHVTWYRSHDCTPAYP
ncbi:hypothetical protein [Streptomyces sp. NPDC092370]